ncbi:hypothetical protein SO802_010821 [Lithocarpus litseifolius]|uniref:Uncharacterized protein n=1 Tax=Lithocarpus litseifolius TaxID=425828 RepID=A0AAW2DGR6_9ROSI
MSISKEKLNLGSTTTHTAVSALGPADSPPKLCPVNITGVKLNDVGGLEACKEVLKEATIWPKKYPQFFTESPPQQQWIPPRRLTNPPPAPSRSLQQFPPLPPEALPEAPNLDTPLLDDCLHLCPPYLLPHRLLLHLRCHRRAPGHRLRPRPGHKILMTCRVPAGAGEWPIHHRGLSSGFMLILGGLGIVLFYLGLDRNRARSIKVSYTSADISSAIIAYVMSMLFIHIKIPANLR